MYREGRESSLISFRNWTRKSLLFILLLCFAKTGSLTWMVPERDASTIKDIA